MLNIGINMENFGIKRFRGNRNLVGNLHGDYYIIDLRKNIDAKESLLFEPGKYEHNQFTRDFDYAFGKLEDAVTKHLAHHNATHRFFIRGSADRSGNSKPYLDSLVSEDSKNIQYLRRIDERDPNRYGSEPHTQIIPKYYANRHLPNLRAAYLQDLLRNRQSNSIDAIILDGEVTKKKNEYVDRNATLLLYVEWDA